MKRKIDPFLYNVYKIDIHGHDRFSCIVEINNAINYCVKTNQYTLVIIHGKGYQILKNSTHEYLKKDKRVKEFLINNYNDGETIVKLKE